jgi:hypothetical protein
MSQLLRDGEQQVGRYRVRFARFGRQGWRTQGVWMRLIVTTERLLLLPDDVLQEPLEPPMIISAAEVARAWSVGLGRRDGAVIALRSGELLYLFVDWSQSVRLTKDIQMMTRPAARRAAYTTPANKRFVN